MGYKKIIESKYLFFKSEIKNSIEKIIISESLKANDE